MSAFHHMAEKIDHYYVYTFDSKNRAVYERTCGSEGGAEKRVTELRQKYNKKAVWTKNHTIPGAFY
jgi:hypothetical protein